MPNNKRDISLFLKAKDQTARVFKRVTGGLSTLRDSVNGFANSITGLLTGLGAGALGKFFVDTAIGSDKLHASLKTVTGSTEAAADALSELKAFA